jgi:hypothetical protein
LSKIFIPNLSVAFEYQGETHYVSSHIFGRASERQKIDKVKKGIANELGITLITIPFWWGKSSMSLAATIRSYRPDLLEGTIINAPAIPMKMPRTFNRIRYVPSAAKEYDSNEVNPTGW